MGFLRHIIGLVIVLLLSALSAAAMPMTPAASHQAEFFPLPKVAVAEHADVHCAARAPPLAAANVSFTGAFVAERGNGIIMHGHETHIASLGFGVSFDATNRTADTYFGQQRQFWTDDPVQFNGNRVYQRNDQFDPSQVSTWRENGQVVQGTNLERMASGRAPIGNDGRPINLHHMTQTQGGAIAEVTQTFHQQNFGTIHINTGGLPSCINRAEFDAWRADYWRNRAGTWGQ